MLRYLIAQYLILPSTKVEHFPDFNECNSWRDYFINRNNNKDLNSITKIKLKSSSKINFY